MNWQKTIRAALLALLLLAGLFPVAVLPFLSAHYQELAGLPRVSGGSVDLSGVDFSRVRWLPLNGQWLWYENEWIESEQSDAHAKAAPAELPTMWNASGRGESFEPRYGIGSYVLELKNCPSGWLVYLPNADAAYRVYMNGELVATSGTPSRDASRVIVDDEVVKNILTLPAAGSVRVVVEVSAKYTPVLNSTPILAEASHDSAVTSIRYALAGICIGVYLVFTIFFAFVLLSKDRMLSSPWLVMLSILLLLIAVRSGELGATARLFFPFTVSREYYTATTVLTNFVPTLLLLSAGDLLQLSFSRGEKAACLIPLLLSLAGQYVFRGVLGSYVALFRAIGFLPALISLALIGRAVQKQTENALLFAGAYIALISGLLVSVCVFLGLYVFNLAIWFPSSLVMFFTLLTVVYVRRSVAAQKAERDAQEKELEYSRLQLRVKQSEGLMMLSQIRPHFIYNALIVIYNLNGENPEKAGEAILKFAKYLRVNMRLIGGEKMIPFPEELSHIQNYVSIEMLRFEDRLHVEYDIRCDDFSLPPLSVQPLVENAIKHGVCKKLGGGTVRLSTAREGGSVRIVVEDDGVGFDTAVLSSEQTESLGIRNIQKRLELYSAGVLTIESEPGRGTKATIQIHSGEGQP
jgi:signal transduction histidine kinase